MQASIRDTLCIVQCRGLWPTWLMSSLASCLGGPWLDWPPSSLSSCLGGCPDWTCGSLTSCQRGRASGNALEPSQVHDSWMKQASWGLQRQSSVQSQHGLLLIVMRGRVSGVLRAVLAVLGIAAEWAVTCYKSMHANMSCDGSSRGSTCLFGTRMLPL